LFAKTEDLTISPSEEFQGPVQIEEPAVIEDDEVSIFFRILTRYLFLSNRRKLQGPWLL
jgi:hypothetical protein